MRDNFSCVENYQSWREKRSDLGPAEIAAEVVARIKKIDKQVRAFCHLDQKVVESMINSSDTDGSKKLKTVPVAVKSNVCIKGAETSCASKMLSGYRPPYNATVIDKLIKNGAMIVGGANMDEYAFGSSCETSYFGPTLNPWDVTRIPGGSSGGSAAAVASGEVPLAIGSDTGGSIRQPASMCGVVGLKPSYGRVSRYGLIAFGSSLDQIGPLARNVHDCATLLEVIAGFDPKDSTSVDKVVPEYSKCLTGDVKGLRIGVPKEYFGEGIDEDVMSSIKRAVALYSDLGADIVEMSLPHTKYALSCYYIIASAEASSNMARYDGVHYGYRADKTDDLIDLYTRSRSEGLGPEVKRRILLGTYALSSGYYDAYYLKAQKVRTKISDDFRKAFTECDLILTPTAPTTAFKLGERTADPITMYLSDIFTIPANLAGLPAITVPCGFDGRSLPIGMQLMAPSFGEKELLNAAFVFENNTDHSTKLPPGLE